MVLYDCSLKSKNREDERTFVLEYIKNTQRELVNLQFFVLDTIKKRIIKCFKRFDYANTGTITRLKFYLVIREALDRSGYKSLHDIYITKIVNILDKTNSITLQEVTSNRITDTILTLIQSKTTLKHKEPKVKQIHIAVEYINKNFDLYDCLKEGKVTRDNVLLMFNRLCSEDNDVIILYNDFDKLWNEFGYTPLTKLSKESLMTFILTYIHQGVDIVVSSRKVSATQESNENVVNKKENERLVRSLTMRVNRLEKALTSTKPNTNKENKEQQIESKPLKPLMTCFSGRYYPITHMCTSEYCLLCHGIYH